VRFVVTRDPKEFAERAERFLAARVECNVLATILLNVLDGVYADASPVFAYGLGDGDEVVFAALRTPPWPLLTSPLDSGASEFVTLWLQADPALGGVTSVPDTARAIAEAWERRCMLYTDLDNPTSNKIYAEVGYRRALDWEEIAFEPAGA